MEEKNESKTSVKKEQTVVRAMPKAEAPTSVNPAATCSSRTEPVASNVLSPSANKTKVEEGTFKVPAVPRPLRKRIVKTSKPNMFSSQNVAKPNMSRSQIVAKLNMSRSQIVAIPNMSRSQIVAIPNMSRSQNVAKPNMSRSQNVAKPNMSRSQNVASAPKPPIKPKHYAVVHKKINCTFSKVVRKPKTRIEVVRPHNRDHKQDELSDPNDLFNEILLADIMSCMRLLPVNNPKRKKNGRVLKCSDVRLKQMDPLTLYGIGLHRYANNMCEMIRVVELAIESNLTPPADPAPIMPKKPPIQQRHNRNSLNYMPKHLTSFGKGNGNVLPEMGSTVIREILGQCVAAIVGLLGFETTHKSVLDTLIDVLIEFFKKVAYRCKLAYEDEQRGWLNGFPHIAERVLVELGMGGCKGLHSYYQGRVVRYVQLLETRCNDLNKHYTSLIARKSPPTEDPKLSDMTIKVEAEEEVVEIDIPQVQLALNEELELPSLDAGFQLLNSLEAGT